MNYIYKIAIAASIFNFYAFGAFVEIEYKISLNNQMSELLKNWLENNAQYKGESEQSDYYLTKEDEPWDYSKGFKDTLRTFRVRCEKKGDSVCFKYRHLDPVTKKTTHRDEYETHVQNGKLMLEILKQSGFSEQTLVHKIRKTYTFDNKFEITIDKISGIGEFVEIELKNYAGTVQDGLKDIETFLRYINLLEFKQYDRSYIHMIWNPGYEFGTDINL